MNFVKLIRLFIEKTSLYIDNYLDKNLDSLLVESKGITKSPKDLREGNLINHEINCKKIICHTANSLIKH